MKFKEHFLLTENPDDLYNHDPSSITFGFCSNFVFWFDPTQDTSFIPTHVELLLIAKAKHLNKPIEALVQSSEYRRKLNSFKKLYHEKGYMPLDCVNFLKGTDMLYGTTRDDFINDVPHAFLGRLSIKGNIISFWNPPNNFNDHTKQTVKDFLGYVDMNPEALMYNFELQGSREINLTYHQFFNIKKEEPKTKVNTSHIVHTTDPAKKQDVLKGMGVKPKMPVDIKTKYAMGESFKDHFNTLIESPDKTISSDKTDQILVYREYDARAFIIEDDFICIANNWNTKHGQMYSDIENIFKYKREDNNKSYIMVGQPSIKFLSHVGTDVYRSDIVAKFPNWIQGRLWKEHNYISFWNHGENVINNLSAIEKVITLVGGNPNEYKFEIDNDKVKTLQELKNNNVSPEYSKDTNWQQAVHMLPPEKKGNALKAMGAKPKPAKGVEARYAAGESFKDHFNKLYQEDAETVYYTDEAGDEKEAIYYNVDAKAFIIDGDYSIMAENNDMYHGDLLTKAASPYPKNVTIHGTPSDAFKEVLKGDKNRNLVLRVLPNVIQGRLWSEQKVIGFWNTIGSIKHNFNYIVKMFKDNNLNPAEFQWEIPDVSEIYSFDDFKQELGIRVPDKEEPNAELSDWQNKHLHLVPPDKKGEMMKAQGIKPKAPLGAEQRYKMGESFKQHFLNYIKESFDWDNLKYQYSSPENYNLHRLDFFNKQGAVGYIEWDKDDGETEKIYVGEPYRRKGIASHIWEVATEWANDNKQLPPEHSSRRSESGEAFAQSVGGYIPNLKDDIDGWSSK